MWLGFIVMAGTWLSNNTEMLINLVPAEYSDLCGYAIGIAIWIIGWVTTKSLEEKRPGYSKTEPKQTKLDEELSKNDLNMF